MKIGKFRRHEWINTNTMDVVYGIQRLGEIGWQHVSEGNKPLFFATAEEREKKLRLLNQNRRIK